VRIKEPGLYGQIEQETVKIDADGQFEFELCQGIKYTAFAFAGPMRSAVYSAPVEFTPTKVDDGLVLTLDQTSEEFSKLRPPVGDLTVYTVMISMACFRLSLGSPPAAGLYSWAM
jgi:hypothetical protein